MKEIQSAMEFALTKKSKELVREFSIAEPVQLVRWNEEFYAIVRPLLSDAAAWLVERECGVRISRWLVAADIKCNKCKQEVKALFPKGCLIFILTSFNRSS